MLTRITVHVESMDNGIPKFTERSMSLDFETEAEQYIDTVTSLVAGNIVELVGRTIEVHTGTGTTKQLTEGKQQDGKDSKAEAMPRMPAVAPTEVLPPLRDDVPDMSAQRVDVVAGVS